MSKLAKILRESIVQDGPMPVETYMAVALGHPQFGYYTTRDPFGPAGDFVTAPEVSQMFGELIGIWAAEAWAALGSPGRVALIELGPGRGTLMADALRAARVVPAFRSAIHAHLVETSPVLIEAQRRVLAGSGVPATWHASLDDVPEGPAIIIANEFFDAMPVRHYVRTGGGWRQRLVGLTETGALGFGVSSEPEPYLMADAPEGAVLEISPISHQIMNVIAQRIAQHGCAALVIDYGHVETGFGETLQALKNHRSVDPLGEPGDIDLTAHVDFAALTRSAIAAGADVLGPATQGEFLIRLGLEQRATALKRSATLEQARAIDQAFERLVTSETFVGPGGVKSHGMGSLFKALAIVPRGSGVLPGFVRETPNV
ncbi:MAG: SAM-dependent methyltransferase [Methylobacterium sp.]|uniref:class I SAM-dependent methyltransferase n=1 Tax=Methylobacterium sp. TaxID=409 RepID=UPI0027203BFA|nr:SAM-dependent methyltransferase [Methylobacterium sp.]MDO9429175.1 SAM-dependent methyltransferase [Methylobacterium sp.]